MTADIDFAVVVADWKSYVSLKTRLVASGAFQADSRTPHRLKHRTGLTLDLVPFGGVEGSDRTLEWPPPSETRMSAFGFREAHARAEEVALPGGVRTRIASLPGLALLKLVAWHDRHLREPKKDAQDLWLVAFNYVYCGQEDRLAAERADWFAEPEFDWQCAGSRLLGNDVRDLLDAEGRRRVDEILSKQADQNVPGDLPVEMLPRDQDRARRILKEMLRGLRDR